MTADLYRPEPGAAAANEPLPPIAVHGAGRVGLVTAACLAGLGHAVLCVDPDAACIATLSRGRLPFYEPGLEDLLVRNGRRGRLQFSTDCAAAVVHGVVQVIAVGTPCGPDGAADVRQVLAVARQIGARMQHEMLIVCRSTAPVGTADRVAEVVRAELQQRGALALRAAVVANPEFLREGTAVEDFMVPERVVVGAADARSLKAMYGLYAPLLKRPQQWLPMSVRGAELTAYASSAMLAARVSVINELAVLADALRVDIDDVRRGLAGDPRIGGRYLAAGCGFGGPGLPDNLRALQRLGTELGVALPTLAGADQTNARQKALLAQRAIEHFGGSLVGRRVALWGLAFKAGTDDLRDAPSETIVARLAAAGARIVAHDPLAMPAARRHYGSSGPLSFAVDALQAIDGADVLLIATDCPEYRHADWSAVRMRMAHPNVLDGRNICDPGRMSHLGFVYRGVGRTRFEELAASLAPTATPSGRASVGVTASPRSAPRA